MEKKRYGDTVYLTEEEYERLRSRLGEQQTKKRIKRLMQLKAEGRRPVSMKSDYQALQAMTPRAVEPIRSREQIACMKKVLREESERDYFLFLLGLNTGLRIGDLLPLQAGDVRGRRYIVRHDEKTGKEKLFPMNKEIRSLASDYTAGMTDEAYLFASAKTKQPIKRDRAYKILRRAAEKAGAEFVGTHTLRKTFGYHFYKQYGDVSTLQNIFNHSSPSITLRYIGIAQEQIDEAMDDFHL
ncbi:site-specific integrase [Alkalicoccus chagannorensis]|uniref:site-specific integrase n=1 Tax=Alkalicoccus chagannorensis TaxID=427072 RepID=UPI001FE11D79|nr:site-specific integrase [Alkalicoccus chagannorensis]